MIANHSSTVTGKSLFEIGMEHLMRMDRVRAIEGALAFQALSNQIREFLQEFKDSNEVVTEADIRRFFEVCYTGLFQTGSLLTCSLVRRSVSNSKLKMITKAKLCSIFYSFLCSPSPFPPVYVSMSSRT